MALRAGGLAERQVERANRSGGHAGGSGRANFEVATRPCCFYMTNVKEFSNPLTWTKRYDATIVANTDATREAWSSELRTHHTTLRTSKVQGHTACPARGPGGAKLRGRHRGAVGPS